MATATRAALLSLSFALFPQGARSADAPRARPAEDAARLPAEIGRGRPVVLHFWATWCEACEAEFGRLRETLNALPARGVAVGLVSIDAAGTRARAPAQLERLGVGGLPSFFLEAPDPAPVAAALGEPRWDGTLPATFVFDARGRKVAALLGTTTGARLERAVGKALKARASAAARPPAPPKD